MSIRPVKRLVKAKPTLEGAGVHLRRAFGFGNTSDFDPFLLLDDFAHAGAQVRNTVASPVEIFGVGPLHRALTRVAMASLLPHGASLISDRRIP